jgi:hypothetical protein
MSASVLGLPTVLRIGPANPDFDISRPRLRKAWAQMAAHPRPLDRPVVILSGWRSVTPAALVRNLCELTSRRRSDFLSISYPLTGDLDRAVGVAMKVIGARFPDAAELDVVGISMGGLVARAAAARKDGPRLAIKRLFTLATPHRGAKLANRIRVDEAGRCMRPGSDYLCRLDEELLHAEYELVCYARLGDGMVGARNAAPPGREPIWVPSALVFSHLTISGDRAIAADIARRLRGEEPLGREGAPPPRD